LGSNKTEHIPYVYIIRHKSTGLKYIGVEYSNGRKIANPSNLWSIYFTSSKTVASLISVYGKNDFQHRILHTFPADYKSAILKEAEYLSKIKSRKDYMNMCYSSGIIDPNIASKGGKVGGAISYRLSKGIHTKDKSMRAKWAGMGGEVSGKVQAELGLGCHKFYKEDPEGYSKWCRERELSKENHKFRDSAFQSEMGKRGGVKNKGFSWYNDGQSEYKYTTDMRQREPFESFIIENPDYTEGRIISKTPIKCPYCSKIGTSMGGMKRHHFDNCKKRT